MIQTETLTWIHLQNYSREVIMLIFRAKGVSNSYYISFLLIYKGGNKWGIEIEWKKKKERYQELLTTTLSSLISPDTTFPTVLSFKLIHYPLFLFSNWDLHFNLIFIILLFPLNTLSPFLPIFFLSKPENSVKMSSNLPCHVLGS